MSLKPEQLSAIIIEDDLRARDTLKSLLQGTGLFSVTGTAGSIEEGTDLMGATHADVAFLDVELSDGNSFEILDRLKNSGGLPYIIFTTSYDKYAIQAFKYAAFDYLLKPIVKEELLQCIQRLLEAKRDNNHQQRIEDLLLHLQPVNKLRFNTLFGFILIDPVDILYIQADCNYSDIYLSKDKRELLTYNIGKLEEMLPTGQFFRINRSHIVNLRYLTRVNTSNLECTLVKDQETVILKASHKRISGMKRP
ncbi:MAG: LytTR family DNA-binding domain-containing protein [Bacteroidetes bacterium]|nr:LytTR family DNA-binding domain-containing protein [Bacteroidota bacterium]